MSDLRSIISKVRLIQHKPNLPVLAVACLCILSVGALVPLLVATENQSPAAVETDEEYRTFLLRIFDDDTGELLYSSWGGETGILEPTEASTENGTDYLIPLNPDELPAYFGQILTIWELAPDNSMVSVSNVRLSETDYETVVLPKEVRFPRDGSIEAESVDEYMQWDNETNELLPFAGQIPWEITDIDETRIHYRFMIDGQEEFRIDRTEGLNLVAIPSDDGEDILFNLKAPEGLFETLGCVIDPDRTLDPGFYVIENESGDDLVMQRFDSRLDYDLQSRLVTIEAQFQ